MILLFPDILLTRLDRIFGARSVPAYCLLCVLSPFALLYGVLYASVPASHATPSLFLGKLATNPLGLLWLLLSAALFVLPLRQGVERLAWNCAGGLLGQGIALGAGLILFAVTLPALTLPYGAVFPLFGPPIIAGGVGPLLSVIGVLWAGGRRPVEEGRIDEFALWLKDIVDRFERRRLALQLGVAALGLVACLSMAVVATLAKGCMELREEWSSSSSNITLPGLPSFDFPGLFQAVRRQWKDWRTPDTSAPLPTAQEAGTNPLILAAIRGDLAGIEALTAAGEDVNAEGFDSIHGIRVRPLKAAFEAGQAEAAELLLSKGATFWAGGLPDLRGTGLMYAADRGDLELARKFLALGTDVNAADPQYGWTALMFAVKGGNAALVKELLEKGADPEKAALDGISPRERAAENPEILALLAPASP